VSGAARGEAGRGEGRALPVTFPTVRRHLPRRYHPKEVCAVHIAAATKGIPPRTITRWCNKYGIGSRRSLARGPWEVSWVALEMLLAKDHRALKALLAGQRQGEPVAPYYEREGLSHLLLLPEFR
jgi:hypothetical protein